MIQILTEQEQLIRYPGHKPLTIEKQEEINKNVTETFRKHFENRDKLICQDFMVDNKCDITV